jgi:serine phosphatase RsbU (regulator of sigma subunit)
MKKLIYLFVIFIYSCDNGKYKKENINYQEITKHFSECIANSNYIELLQYSDSLANLYPTDRQLAVEINYAKGVYYNITDDNQNALVSFNKCMQIDSTTQYRSLRQLGILNRKIGNLHDAETYLKLSLIGSHNDTLEYIKSLLSLQKLEIIKDNPVSAKYYNSKCKVLAKDTNIIRLNDIYLSEIYYYTDQLEKADSILNNLSYSTLYDNAKIDYLKIKSNILIDTKNNTEAVKYLNSCLVIENSDNTNAMYTYKLLSVTTPNKDSALYYYIKYHQMYANLNDIERQQKFIKSQTQFEELLKRKKLEVKNDYSVKLVKKQMIIIYGFIGLFVILTLFIIFAIYAFKHKIKTNNQLVALNTKVSIHNKEMIDNINYASTIQNAILPDINALRNMFPKSYLYYSPKDIVSGDFYYFHEQNGKKYIAVADCTGHGVSGAMLTMMAYNKLSELIDNNTSFGSILSELNKSINRSLGDSSNNGLEISLVCIDGTMVSVTGANSTIYYTSYGDNTLEEIKTTKGSIGCGMSDSKQYDVYTIPKPNVSSIIMFTDGVVDQFGGNNNKKLMQKRLKQFINSSTSDDITFEKFFTEWKSDNEQTDDVTYLSFNLR